LIRQGRHEEAGNQLRLALDLKPDDQEATQMLHSLKKPAK
jgi:Flp pilus assembly protein TadD